MLISSLFSGGSQQSQPKGAEKQKDKSETGNTEKNNAKAKDEQPAAQETQPSAETAPAQSSQAAAPAQKAQAPAAEAPAPVAPTPGATSDSGMSEAQARAAAEARIEAAQARSLIDSIAPVSSSPQQASKSYLSALLKSNAPTEAASTAKSAAEPVADKADKALKAAA